MRKKTPGSRCLPRVEIGTDNMGEDMINDPSVELKGKLLNPSLTLMITKTIKALCEVNIRYDFMISLKHIISGDHWLVEIAA